MSLEHVVVVVHALIGGPEGDVVAVGGVEFDAADVGPGVLGPPFGL